MLVADLNSLTTHLDALAASTWHKVAVGPRRGLKFREESLTDHNLFDLDGKHPGLSVYKFTGLEEAMNGADFDWWIGTDSLGWIGLRFQAKKLDDGAYSEIGHRVGTEMQYDILIRESSCDGVWPLYCFYNGWEAPWPSGVTNLTCPDGYAPTCASDTSSTSRCIHTDLEDFGCAVASAVRVRDRHRGKRRGRLELDDYLAMSLPWSRLVSVRPSPTATRINDSRMLNRIEEVLRDMQGEDSADAARPSRQQRLPHWVQALRLGRLGDEASDLRYARKPRMVALLDLAGDR